MSSEETFLFLAVIALGLALVAVVVGPKLKMRGGRRSRRGAASGQAGDAQGAAGLPGASVAASTAPVPAPSPSAGADAAMALPPSPPVAAEGHLTCPTCRRTFSAGLRFCPYDARLLTPEAAAVGEHQRVAEGPWDAGSDSNAPGATEGKICPTCARRYELGAVVCARDGAALVSVN